MTEGERLIALLDDNVNMGRLEAVRRLLEQGADVNSRNVLGDTPLMTAGYIGGADMVRLLFAFGADREAKNRDGKTAHELALAMGHQEAILAFAKQGAT